MEAVTYFLFLGSKITADGDCSHEIRRRLFLGRKAMTNQDSVLKSKRHHFVDKGPYSQGYGLSRSHIWFWDLDHKECRAPQNWCFWTVMLEKTLESSLNCKIKVINPKKFNPEYSLEGLMLKLKLQHFGNLMCLTDSLGKYLILGKPEGKRRRDSIGWDG